MGFALKFQLEMTFQIYADGKLQSEKWVTADVTFEKGKERLSGNESLGKKYIIDGRGMGWTP